MIATITLQSKRMAQTQDHRFSNTAGAPLPLIPRRTSSSRPSLTPSTSCPFPTRSSLSASSSSYAGTSTTTTVTTVTPATPPKDDSDSSSSSSSPSDGTRPTIQIRRVRGIRNTTVCPPELSTPIPTLTAVRSTAPTPTPKNNNPDDSTPRAAPSRPMLYTPGMPLRLSIDVLKSRNVSQSHVSLPAETSVQGSQSASALCEAFGDETVVRKKSGQLVRSSLKSSRSSSRTSLSVISFPQSSKSEPTTPTSKAVHFDSKLEHVKLFLAEQKPLAVSRDGSPTDDTSGTDSDFPRFIYGEAGDGRPKKRLVMQVVNMPARINPNLDVALEELSLTPDGTSISGKVRVRNLAFSKWIAIRFTFDSWQTTSEVTGKYLESISSEFDRFAFTIRLNDLLARIEGKTLLLAIRYSVDGREIWDSNNGMNYMATFTKAKIQEERRPTTLSDDEASTDMADLRSKLEKVVNTKDRTGPAFLAQHHSRRQRQQQSASPADDAACFKNASFASRYDFANSLKSPWKPPADREREGGRSFPVTKSMGASPSSSIPWPQKSPSDLYASRRSPSAASAPVPLNKTRGSPRDIADDTFRSVALPVVDPEDPPFHVQPRAARNHQRGYFDISVASAPTTLRRTPPGIQTPRSPSEWFGSSASSASSTPPPRYNSFPPMAGLGVGVGMGMEAPAYRSVPAPAPAPLVAPAPVYPQVDRFVPDSGGDSELSTPSMATPSSSRSSTPSPSPDMFLNMEDMASMSPDTHYRNFLNKFCFFTGPGSTIVDTSAAADLIPRTHSESDIEEFLSGLSPRLEALAERPTSPMRSSSLDDLMLSRSGSLTPTVSRLSLLESRNATTPVLS